MLFIQANGNMRYITNYCYIAGLILDVLEIHEKIRNTKTMIAQHWAKRRSLTGVACDHLPYPQWWEQALFLTSSTSIRQQTSNNPHNEVSATSDRHCVAGQYTHLQSCPVIQPSVHYNLNFSHVLGRSQSCMEAGTSDSINKYYIHQYWYCINACQ